MAQHGAAGWAMGHPNSAMEDVNAEGTGASFVGAVEPNTSTYLDGPASHGNDYEQVHYPNTNPYGQQTHGQYENQSQYSSLAFAVESQTAFPQNVRSLSPAQIVGQSHNNNYQDRGRSYPAGQAMNYQQLHTPELANQYIEHQPQRHVGLNEFQRNSWVEPPPQQGPSSPYPQGQQSYGSNPGYGGTYPSPRNAEIRQSYPAPVPGSSAIPASSSASVSTPHTVAWGAQSQTHRLGSVSAPLGSASDIPRQSVFGVERIGTRPDVATPSAAASEAPVIVPRDGTPGDGWIVVDGCPNLFMGMKPVSRQVVTNTPGVKPHVAGTNRNKSRLLPLRKDPLPCEILRDEVRPIMEDLGKVSDKIARTKKQLEAAHILPDAHQQLTAELEKLELEKADLEKEKKSKTGKSSVSKLGKTQVASRSETAEDDSDNLTDSSDGDDPKDVIIEKIMASETRPADPVKGVRHDVVKILQQNQLGADLGAASQAKKGSSYTKVIGKRVSDFGTYVYEMCAEEKALRKEAKELMSGTTSGTSNDKALRLTQLQSSIDQKHELIRLALEAALEFGDEDTLSNMGQHKQLMSVLSAIFRYLCSIGIYNSVVSRAILRFVAKATMMDVVVFKDIKLGLIFNRYGDNLDDEGKELMRRISMNASDKPTVSTQPQQKGIDNAKIAPAAAPTQKMITSATKSSVATSKPQAPQLGNTAAPDVARKETKSYFGLLSARKATSNTDRATAKVSPAKRPRDDETDSRATKKVAVDNGGGPTGTTKTIPASVSTSAAPSNTTPANGQPRPRPSSSTVLGKSRVPARPVKKPEPKKPEHTSSNPSKIHGLLDEIENPVTKKPEPQEKPVEIVETPEEQSRRLRKEARRGRTVTWKPDDQIAQIKYFEHDAAEDEGRASNMIRDARDTGSEGQTLKEMTRNKNKEGGDDDEDVGLGTAEEEVLSWKSPSQIDFSHLDGDRREKNYPSRGGVHEIDSGQKKIMDDYENHELMTVYTSTSEIPNSARSPPETAMAEPWVPPREGIAPKHDTGSNRAPSRLNNESRMMTQQEREAEVLRLLRSDEAKNYVDPDPPHDPANPKTIDPPQTQDPVVQKAFETLARLVKEMEARKAAREAAEAAEQPHNGLAHIHEGSPSQSANTALPRTHEEYVGYNSASATGTRDGEEHARKAAEGSQTQYNAPQTSHFATYQQQAHAPPQTLQQQQYGYSQAGAPLIEPLYDAILQEAEALRNSQAAQRAQNNSNLALVLATLRHSTQPAQETAQDPNYAAWQSWVQQQAQSYGAQAQAQPQAQSYPSYLQQYDPPSRDETTYGSQKQDNQSQGQYQRDSERGNRKEFHRGTKDQKGINRALIGTKPCTFWAKGQCAKGDNCTFRHDPKDLK